MKYQVHGYYRKDENTKYGIIVLPEPNMVQVVTNDETISNPLEIVWCDVGDDVFEPYIDPEGLNIPLSLILPLNTDEY